MSGRDPRKCGLQFVGFEPERPGSALVGYASARINQEETIRPCRVGTLRRVAKFVEHRWNFDSEFAHTRTRNHGALVFGPRTGEDDLVFDVVLHLPHIAGMRFGDVDDEELDLVRILLVELVEGGNLPPERRSSVA